MQHAIFEGSRLLIYAPSHRIHPEQVVDAACFTGHSYLSQFDTCFNHTLLCSPLATATSACELLSLFCCSPTSPLSPVSLAA